ncbi:MAG TPA: PKD domain-containing protein, partial [Puia sp.]
MRNPKSYSILFKNIFLVLCCIVCHAGFSQNRFAKDYAVGNIHSLSSGQNEPVNIKPLTGPALVVPVVFHIVSSHPASITDQQIQSFIQDLNNAFAHAGNYRSGNGSNTRITFSLARTGPEGGISSGITRTQSALGDFDGDIENNRLKKLISWDTKAYCNVWLVDGIRNEYFTSFSCGNWSRKYNTGYTSFSPNGDYRDGIVTSQSGPVLAMLMGKYLGLNFTFVLGSCSNKNCNTDGDGICDTPPASGPGNSCAGYKNSCTTDTVSGFSKDVPDLDSNFMSFSGNCTNSFTEGQAEKMRSTLTGERNSLLTQGKCNPPCSENLSAVFDRNNWFPVPGDVIQFRSVSTGATGFQWTLNDQAAGSNSPDFTYRFNDAGRYKVTLKAFNTNQACNVAYSDSVIVGCGVMARFYPDKRLIASKDQILNDTISFTNRSVNGGNYQWWISNNSGILPQIVSTDPNLIKFFPSPGQYAVWLVAFNGDCSDTSEKFIFNVLDPTMDATISFENVECYEETKIKVDLRVCNQGYAPLPAGTPITFYDGDPRTDTAKKLDQTYLLTSEISGNCCKGYSTIINTGRLGLNRLYAAINDKGGAVPVHFPNTSVPEKAFTNNIAFDSNFKFRVTAVPSSAVLEPGDTLQISANAGPGVVLSYLWSSNVGLNCSDCANPFFIAGRENVTKKVVAASSYGCTDSTFVTIKIPFADDYVITVDSMTCANDSSVLGAFTIRNKFARGTVPDGLKVSFYEGDPATDTARLLQPVYSVKSN